MSSLVGVSDVAGLTDGGLGEKKKEKEKKAETTLLNQKKNVTEKNN